MSASTTAIALSTSPYTTSVLGVILRLDCDIKAFTIGKR
jgi:hypothetical protein